MLFGRHVSETGIFDRDLMERIFSLADDMRDIAESGGSDALEGAKMISLFCGESIKTRASFEAAMRLLGGEVVFSSTDAKRFSSAIEGVLIKDSIELLSNSHYPNVIVFKSDKEGDIKKAVGASRGVPIISAGDGKSGEHPIQALADMYTIREEFGRIDNISIAMIGDCGKNRAIHSLCKLLSNFKDVAIYFVSPEGFGIGGDIVKYLHQKAHPFGTTNNLRDIIGKVDVVYQTKIETSGDPFEDELYEKMFRKFQINKWTLDDMKKEARILHPMPIGNEIKREEVDQDERAAYVKQMKNVLYVCMAILEMVLSSPSGMGCLAKDLAIEKSEGNIFHLPMAAGSQMKH